MSLIMMKVEKSLGVDDVSLVVEAHGLVTEIAYMCTSYSISFGDGGIYKYLPGFFEVLRTQIYSKC